MCVCVCEVCVCVPVSKVVFHMRLRAEREGRVVEVDHLLSEEGEVGTKRGEECGTCRVDLHREIESLREGEGVCVCVCVCGCMCVWVCVKTKSWQSISPTISFKYSSSIVFGRIIGLVLELFSSDCSSPSNHRPSVVETPPTSFQQETGVSEERSKVKSSHSESRRERDSEELSAVK